MRIVFSLVLVLGLGLAGFAAWKTSDYINTTKAREQAALRQIVPTVRVFVANKPLPFGHVLTEQDVAYVAWPQNALPENIFTDPKILFHSDTDRKRTVLRQMEKFEPLLAMKLTEPGADAGINTRLAHGMRAFPIAVDARNTVASMARVGDRLDVYWSGNAGNLGPDVSGEITKLIETGVTVIATDDGGRGGARSLTVEATPQQVARLTQAQMSGRLSISLMGVGDDTTAEVSDVDRRGLLGFERIEAAPVEREKVCTIRTRRAGEVVEIPIPCTN